MTHLKFLMGIIIPLTMPLALAACGGDEPDDGNGGQTTPPVVNDKKSTVGLDKYSESNIFSRNAELAVTCQMQGFSIDSNGSVWYTMLYDTELYVSNAMPNKGKTPAPAKSEQMKLTYFGHGTNTAVEEAGNDRYIWAGCYGSCNADGAYWNEKLIGRVKYVNGATVATDQCDEYFYAGDFYHVQPTVDAEHDQLVIQYNYKGNVPNIVYFVVYKLSEAKKAPIKTFDIECTDGFKTGNKRSTNKIVTQVKAHDLTTLKQVAAPKCPWKEKPGVTYYPWQGYDVNGNLLYFVEGAEGAPSNAYLTIYDLVGRVVEERTKIKAVSDAEFSASAGLSQTARFESEGVKVKNGKLYMGFSNRGISPSDNRYYQTILQYDAPQR